MFFILQPQKVSHLAMGLQVHYSSFNIETGTQHPKVYKNSKLYVTSRLALRWKKAWPFGYIAYME